jgi:hypothetical protein
MVDYLDHWAPSSLVSRSYDATTSLYHQFPQPYSRRQNLTSCPLSSSVLPTPDTRMDKRPLQPRSGYKKKPFTQSRRCEKLHFHPSSALSLSLFLLQLALTTLALAICSIYSVPRQANCSSVFVPNVKEKLRVDREKNSSQDATHDSVLGRARVISLDIVRDVPLYRRRIMSAISCACAHSSSTSSRTTMR